MSYTGFDNPPVNDRFKRDQSGFISESLRHAPKMFHKRIESRFNWKLKKNGLCDANLDLLKITERLKNASIRLTFDDDAICDKAEQYATECGRSVAAAGLLAGRAYSVARGAIIPECEEAGEVARITDARWWRRQLRVRHGRAVEGEALNLNIVNRRAEIYASNASVVRRKTQKSRNRKILEEVIAVNELGQEFTLQELSDLGVSNPAIRRGELMTRIAGFEAYAQQKKHQGVFWTITAPSRMHSAHSADGRRNSKYDGTTPKETQAYLSKVWARVRAKFARQGIQVYGMRVAEPQHDGTPHWHMLVFMEPGQIEEATAIYKAHAMADSGNEPGAEKYRFDTKLIDWKKGTAAGYIAKYIAKNIDAYGVDYDLYGKDANASVQRVDAWASTWGIRQFQQVGGPSVTIWRELRRMTAEQAQSSDIEKHRAAADVGDWFAYVVQMQRNPVKLLKAWNDKLGRYMEPIGSQIIGVQLSGEEYLTRLHTWSTKNAAGRIKNNSLRGKQTDIEYGDLATFSANDIQWDVSGGEPGSDDNRGSHERAGVLSFETRNGRMRRLVNQVNAHEFTAHVRAYFLFNFSGVSSPSWSSVNNCTEVKKVRSEKRLIYKIISGDDSPGGKNER